jgi:sugar phosphate isomerase/epimerase
VQPTIRTEISRREFNLLGGVLCASAVLKTARAAPAKVPIALQLYSLRNECKTDLPGTLAAVGKMGFQGVEWFGWGGYFDRTPKELRKMLDDNNLKTCSDHIHVDALQGDKFERTMELYQTLGTKLATLSDLTGIRGNRRTAQYWTDAAKQLNELADKLKPYGVRLGMHNHTAEFVKVEDGRVPWEIIFDNTSKEFAQQLHIGGVLAGGLDPADYLKKYAGRTLSMHMVDWAPGKTGLLLGEGDVKGGQIFELAETVGGIEWYIVEQESYPFPPLESVEKSLTNLRKLLALRKG